MTAPSPTFTFTYKAELMSGSAISPLEIQLDVHLPTSVSPTSAVPVSPCAPYSSLEPFPRPVSALTPAPLSRSSFPFILEVLLDTTGLGCLPGSLTSPRRKAGLSLHRTIAFSSEMGPTRNPVSGLMLEMSWTMHSSTSTYVPVDCSLARLIFILQRSAYKWAFGGPLAQALKPKGADITLDPFRVNILGVSAGEF
jgi:hypothetical protein